MAARLLPDHHHHHHRRHPPLTMNHKKNSDIVPEEEDDDDDDQKNVNTASISIRSSSSAGKQQYQPVALELEDSFAPPPLPRHYHEHDPAATTLSRLVACFWMLGLLNNASYVIMIACAKSISEGGTALVFLANVIPSLAVKGSSPFWFDKVHYSRRLQIAAICMATSFMLVAATSVGASSPTPSDNSSGNTTLVIQLLGVAFGSFQCGLGEASLLALAGKVDGAAVVAATASSSSQLEEAAPHIRSSATTKSSKGECLTSFSSGTGMAGVFGFFWKWLWNDTLRCSMSTTLWLALSLAVAYWWSFQYAQRQQDSLEQMAAAAALEEAADAAATSCATSSSNNSGTIEKFSDDDAPLPHERQALAPSSPTSNSATTVVVTPIDEMTSTQRIQLVLSLWPYMLPLFTVYAAEYALQSGTWTAIGFPLESIEARDRFFEYSNWMYQAGVFVSRSSGTLFTAPMAVLWIMPALQCVNLGIYTYLASHPTTMTLLYRPSVLYAGALYTGLLGGAVYIHGYKRICLDIPMAHREFSLSATSMAEGIGIVVADAIGLVVQSCLYQVNHLEGALISCPIRDNIR